MSLMPTKLELPEGGRDSVITWNNETKQEKGGKKVNNESIVLWHIH